MNINTCFKVCVLSGMLLPFVNIHAKQAPAGQDTAACISAIRAEYHRVNISKLKKQTYKYEAEGCVNNGAVTYFFNTKKEIVKIVESGDIGDGSWNREFYFRAGKFFFCYETIVGGPAEGPEMRNEYRTYVKNDQVLQYLEDKTVLTPGENASEAIMISYKLVKAYTTKEFAEALCN
jgi:hypothetical protein